MRFDMQVENYGTDATVNVYLNGNLLITYTGDVTVSGVSSLEAAALSANGANDWEVSEVIVADSDTRNLSLVTMAPTAAGTTDQWTGAYSGVNETTLSTASPNSSTTSGQDQQYELTALPSGTFSVLAVKISAYAETASSENLKLGFNSGGTVGVDGGQALTTAWATYESLFPQNPVTAAAWLLSAMDSLQLDMRSA
jgi:hypothetical protein